MPKPTRRERRLGKIKPTRRPVIPAASPPTQRRDVEEKTSPPVAGVFAGEYEYIYKDLRRIAILAGIIFAALFILSFIFR